MIMPEASLLGLFVVAALVLLLTPGPAVLYIVTRSVEQGRLAGLVSALGVHVGTLVHVAAAALGVSALLVSSALAFDVVKYLGALNAMLMLNLIPIIVFAIEAWLGRSFAVIEIGGAAIVIGALVANNLYQRSAWSRPPTA